MDVIPKRAARGESITSDSIANISRDTVAFNSYVNPREGAIFGESATNVHGLHENHPSIFNADEIHAVWDRCCSWIRSDVAQDKFIVLVTWNGETCNLKWLWKMTQAPIS